MGVRYLNDGKTDVAHVKNVEMQKTSKMKECRMWVKFATRECCKKCVKYNEEKIVSFGHVKDFKKLETKAEMTRNLVYEKNYESVEGEDLCG